ncbi:hypothetical protein [Kitasatospora sp. NPDC057936]|uniref:hypothetical protein n=1 Tax=Kitasatospora sp. NPDC057936 TaxID=3346283 RepID=UPI0036DE4995
MTRTGLDGDALTIIAPTGSHRFEDAAGAGEFTERIRTAARAARATPQAAASLAKAPPDPAPEELRAGGRPLDRLERSAAPHRSGALTDQEFARAEERLPGRPARRPPGYGAGWKLANASSLAWELAGAAQSASGVVQ